MLNNFTFLNNITKAVYTDKRPSIQEYNLIGSRQSGKTKSVAELVCNLLLIGKSTKIYIVRHLTNTLRKTVFAEVMGRLSDLKVANYCKVSLKPMQILYKDAVIYFEGLYTPKSSVISLQGLYRGNVDYCVVWLEEAYELTKEDESALFEAIGGYKHLIIIRTCNPWHLKSDLISYANSEAPFNLAILQDKGEQITKKDKKLFYYSNYKLNHYLADSTRALLEATRQHSPKRARVVCDGYYGISEGTIYAEYLNNFELKATGSHGYQSVIGGIDVGERNDNLAGILIGVTHDKEMHVLHEFVYDFKKRGFQDMAMLAKKMFEFFFESVTKYNCYFNNGGVNIYVDYNYSFISMLNHISEANGSGRQVVFVPCKKEAIEQRIDFLISLLSTERCKIHVKNCPQLLSELEQASYDEYLVNKRQDKNDHSINALEYAYAPIMKELAEYIL